MNTYTIRPVALSCVKAEKGIMTYLSYYGQKVLRPYLFWIIEGAEKPILVDTGIHAEDYKRYHPLFENLPIDHLLSFEEGLSNLGLKTNEIDMIIQTHLHFDHCFNTARCEHAKVIVQEDELEFAKNPHPVFSAMYCQQILKDLNFEIVRGRTEILPGIEVIPVPGHTPGCQAVSINTEAGRAVISGFCCVKENFFPAQDIQNRVSPFAGFPVIIPGIHFDAFKAYESMMKIKRIADILLPVHEPEIMKIDMIP